MPSRSTALSATSFVSMASCLAMLMTASAARAQAAQQPLLPAESPAQSVTLPGDLDAATSIEEEAPAQPQDASSQAATGPADQIVVRGLNERMSSWKRAETDNIIIYSNGSESVLRKAAIEVEQLHFLLSKIFGRLDAEDETQKLCVTLIGNADFMESMSLVNWRAAEGPFLGPVQNQRYYDPRIDGAVMAVTRADLFFSAASGATQRAAQEFFGSFGDSDFAGGGFDEDGFGDSGFNDDPGPPDFIDNSGGDQERPWEQALFAGYAQHYITTHLPEAYPRWYIDGIGALFSTFRVNDKGNIEYGRSPPAFRGLYNNSDRVDIAELLASGAAPEGSIWSSHHAWLLAHFFFLSADNQNRKTQLAQYMGAIANGRTPQDAVKVFGDLEKLQDEINAYGSGRSRFATVPLAELEAVNPDIRSLGVTEAGVLQEQFEIDARLILPPLPLADTPPKDAERMQRAHERALVARDKWMDDLRRDVAGLAGYPEALLLLAQAECRLGNFDACLAAAEGVLADTPNDQRALSWKAIALVNKAANLPPETRAAEAKAARALVVAANRANPDALMPLVAYFRSFTDAGEPAPEAAMLGMLKVIQAVPNAPEPRLMLAQELRRQSRTRPAETILLPVVMGPWDSPERQLALSN